MEPSELQQRGHDRFMVNQPVMVEGKNRKFQTELIDVSLGGAKIRWPEPPDQNELITVYFTTELYFTGEIRWIQFAQSEYEIGLMFHDLVDIASLYLAEYIEHHLINPEESPETDSSIDNEAIGIDFHEHDEAT